MQRPRIYTGRMDCRYNRVYVGNTVEYVEDNFIYRGTVKRTPDGEFYIDWGTEGDWLRQDFEFWMDDGEVYVV